MASQEDFNKPQCENNLNNEQETNFITVYKKLEQVLNNKNDLFKNKVECLIEAWKRVCIYSTVEHIQYIVQLMDWVKLHTLNIVLNGEWKKCNDIYEEKLLNQVVETEKALLKLNSVFSSRCRKIAEVIQEPWGNPILERLLNQPDTPIGPEEVEFFCGETGYLVSMRLKKLCESRCEDLALNLVSAFQRCYKMAEVHQFNLNATEKQRWFIFDVYIALLYKYKELPVVISTLKTVELKDGFELVKRFANKRVTISKIWRHSAKIAQLACQVFVTATLMKPVEETGSMLNEFLQIWFVQNDKDSCLEPLMADIRRIIQEAESAHQMYIFCDAVYEKYGKRLKTFIIELYIRALTADMNDLERQKNENDTKTAQDTTKRLADGFCKLAKVLEEHISVSRECVLTSFSLQPTEERLKQIQDCARKCGFTVLDTGQEWKCKLHPPALKSDDVSWVCNVCGDYMSQPHLEVNINTNTALCEALTAEQLGLSPQLCDDLAVVLSSPRNQVFSWLLRWDDLHRLCFMYLQDPERTKNIVTELKFVDIDYSLFMGIKREPIDDERTGIERGYEHFLEFYEDADALSGEDSASQDYSLGSDGAGEMPKRSFPLKSDPNVLKSLRMFRPNLKKSRLSEKPCKLTELERNLRKDPYRLPYAFGSMYTGQVTTVYANPSIILSNDGTKCTEPLNYMKSNLDNGDEGKKNEAGNLNVNLCSRTGNIRTYTKKCNKNQEGGTSRETEDIQEVRGGVRVRRDLGHLLFNNSDCNLDVMQLKQKKVSCKENPDDGDQLSGSSIEAPSYSSLSSPPSYVSSHPENQDAVVLFDSEVFRRNLEWERVATDAAAEKITMRNVSETTPCWTEESEPSNVPKVAPEETQPTEVVISVRTDLQNSSITPESNELTSNGIKQEDADANTFSFKVQADAPQESKRSCSPVSRQQKMKWTTEWVNVPKENDDGGKSKRLCTSRLLGLSPEAKRSVDILECQKENCDLKEKFNIKESKVLLERVLVESDVLERYTNSEVRQKLKETTENNNILRVNAVYGKAFVEGVPKRTHKRRKQSPAARTNDRNSGSRKYFKRAAYLCNVKHTVEQKKIVRSKYPVVRLERMDLEAKLEELANERKKSETIVNNCKEVKVKLVDFVVERGIKKGSPKNDAKTVLANVPGLNDLELIRPTTVDQIVQVVQLSGTRTSTNVTPQSTQTSTQVTPHIQRIGQPKPEQTTTSAPATSTQQAKPVASQHSTLVNILAQQRPNSGRRTPLINILSQQIIRPGNSALKQQTTTTTESNSSPRVVAVSETQAVTPVTTVKTVAPATSDQNHIVQFVCKSTDGKLIPVTSLAANKVVKVATTQTVTSTSPPSPTYDNYKLVKVAHKSKTDAKENSESLPKFQQAFGKPVYQNNLEPTTTTTTTTTTSVTVTTETTDDKKIPKTSAVCVQPAVQGSVIYTRQMPINLIPPGGRGQVFRIAAASSSGDPTVIRGKMSALLAAALQTKKNADGTDASGPDDSAQRVTVTCPTLLHTGGRLVKPVLHIPTNVARVATPQATNVSSTTLEQLREFDMVYKQVKERSSTNTGGEVVVASPEGGEPSQQRISVAYLNQGQKFTQLSPVVVVSSYCSFQPAASPALSVTSQGSSSPCVTPAPAATIPKVSSKNSKGKIVKNSVTSSSKASPIPKPQQKPQEDEHTTQRIFDILAEYAEQLRNSPDLNNKPAPRRRSNPPTNPNQNSKRKKSSSSKKGQCSSTLSSDADVEDPRTIGSEDSSCGVVQLSMQEDEQPPTPVNTSESNDASSVTSCPQLVLSESPAAQPRPLIIADSSVGEALKIPNTAVLVPGNYIMPVSMVKGGQQIAVVSGGSKILATVPARSGPNMLLFQSFLNQKSGVPAVKFSSQQIAGMSAQQPVILPSTAHNLSAVTLGQPITLKKIDGEANREMVLISHPTTYASNAAAVKTETTEVDVVQKTEPKQEPKSLQEETKAATERVQSVLVTASTSNGPMLSHNPPHYCKTDVSNSGVGAPHKERNGGKNLSDQKNSAVYLAKKKTSSPRLDRELQQLSLQRKQAAYERELRLQKSLSEECEDLGVDEPSTSELFPEADLLFDSNHSPSFDQSPQDVRRASSLQTNEPKEESKSSIGGMTLFGDEDSASMRTDFLFEPVEYATVADLEYDRSRQLTNGQSSTSTESGSSCGDSALMQNCPSISDVALNSPVSPDTYADNTPPAVNKYKYKYSNRKKADRHKQESWPAEVSSSDDTTGSSEACLNRRHLTCDDEIVEGATYKIVHVTHNFGVCEEEMQCDEDMGRGARRSVKKKCSCCNGTPEGGRKRPGSNSNTPVPHKKTFPSKKR